MTSSPMRGLESRVRTGLPSASITSSDDHCDLLEVDRTLMARGADRMQELVAGELLPRASRLITMMPSRTRFSIVVKR